MVYSETIGLSYYCATYCEYLCLRDGLVGACAGGVGVAVAGGLWQQHGGHVHVQQAGGQWVQRHAARTHLG
jgi:hypothetical protein